MRFRSFASVLLTLFASITSGQAPVPVVERTVTQGEVATRVSLFTNRVVVVSVHIGKDQAFFRRITLPEDDYMVYLGVFESNSKQLSQKPITSAVETSHAEAVVHLNIGPDAPRVIRFSPMSSVKLPFSRILAALDDLQLQVHEASPSSEALRQWEPRKGDRVELLIGTMATVVEAWDDGLVILEHDATYIRESVTPEMRDQIILRVVERAP